MMPATPLPPLLAGRRVRLRPFTAADLTDAYVGWLNDPEVVRYSNQRFLRHTRESCERYFASFAGSANLFVSLRVSASMFTARATGASGNAGVADVVDVADVAGAAAGPDEIAVGTMTAYRSLPHGTADVGILLGHRAAWGQGIGLEAWQLLTDWLLTTPGLRKVTAGTLACNRAMLSVAERSGMAREGVRRAHELVDGVPTDIVHFARFTPVASQRGAAVVDRVAAIATP